MALINKLTKWYFTKSALPYWSVLLIDCVMVVVAGFITLLFNHDITVTFHMAGSLLPTAGIALLCFIFSFRLFHTYSGVMRYSSFTDLMRVVLAGVVAVGIFYVLQLIFAPAHWFPRFDEPDIALWALLIIAMMWLLRIWVKLMYEVFCNAEHRTRVFILGVRDGGVALAKNINSSPHSPYRVAGFVSNEPEMCRHRLMGVKVHMFNKDLPKEMFREHVHDLLISPLMMNVLSENEDLVDALADAHIKMHVVPNSREWDGKSDLSTYDLKPVNVEDLLPREKIDINMDAAAKMLTDKVVMITGAAGSIGSEMVRQIATYKPSHLVLIDQAETPMHDILRMMRSNWPNVNVSTIVSDISDKKCMERIFKETRPEYVFHAAAYKHVPMMEDNPYESVVNNIQGTKNIADLAVKYGTKKFVMVSTDKAVNPTNVMGCSKRICEIYVQSLDKKIKDGEIKGVTQFVTTRFGNVLGSNGSVIPIFQEQIRKHQPITVTHPDIIRFFMLISEACKLVIEAGTMGNGGEIYVFDMGKPVKITDLARRMIRLSGAKDIDIVYTGLRDGEKLYEEVLNDQETTLPTFHPKIKVAKVREYDYYEVDSDISTMIATAAESTDMEIVARMKAIVPEFVSQHSKYEVLDKKKEQLKKTV